MTLMVSHDSGYGRVKDFFIYKDEETKLDWPALVSQPSEMPKAQSVVSDSPLDDMVLEYDAVTYWMGNKAYSSRTRQVTMNENKLEMKTELLKLLCSLAYISETTGESSFKVVTGIPVSQYEQFRSVVGNSWKGNFNVRFRGKPYTLRIENVLPLAQGSGVYYSLTMDTDSILDTDLFRKRVCIWDLGSGTTNVPLMQRGKFLGDNSDTLWNGTNVTTIYLNLRQIIQKRHGISFDVAGVDEIVRQGYLLYKGQRQIITQELTDAAEPVIHKIVADSQTFLNLERDIDVAVLASGGACIEPVAHIFKNLMQNYVADVRVVPNPFSNVEGYFYAGRFFEKNKLF